MLARKKIAVYLSKRTTSLFSSNVNKIMDCQNGSCTNREKENSASHHIIEGLADIQTYGKVFYNPVQEFNRDLSISVISTFARELFDKKSDLNKINECGQRDENGLFILEALSATGLRSIRYAKEIAGIKEIVANDISQSAIDDIKRNVKLNGVEDLISCSHSDAIMLMYQHRAKEQQFDVIDLDPYGCPSTFLDSAVQSVKHNGLLLVTATDMAVLAGNCPETCYTKYGSISLRTKSCHEMAIRILLQCIESHANKYSRYIVPLLSISADFYIRVFIQVRYGAYQCKFSLSKLSNVYHCKGCGSFQLQPLGQTKPHDKNSSLSKFSLPVAPTISSNCEHCGSSLYIGGPIWSVPIHSLDFVKNLLQNLSPSLKTFKRIEGVLSMILEELPDVSLYLTLEKLSGSIKVETPPMITLRSAILNAGYKVSGSHANKTAIKTDAPIKIIWDIMRSWEQQHPASRKSLTNDKVAATILSHKTETSYNFNFHPDANSESKQKKLLRFQLNPLPFWGPGRKSQAMIGDETVILKSKMNQGKRKRDVMEGSD